MRSKQAKQWVIVQFSPHTLEAGTIKVWRDYGTAWGSPEYTVLGYCEGSHRQALAVVRDIKIDGHTLRRIEL